MPEDAITWQYCVVPYEYTLPEVYYENIYDVYIPNTENKNDEFDILLEDEAHKILGIETTKGSKWHPSGTIQVNDDYLGFIGVHFVNIRVRYFTHVSETTTDLSGYFYISDEYRFEVNYLINWKYGSKITLTNENTGETLFFNGPKKRGSWDLNMNDDGLSWFYANVFNAIMKYWAVHSFWGIKHPIENYQIPVNVKCFHESEACSSIVSTNIIDFYKNYPNGIRRDSKDIFRSMIHEVAHISHYDMNHFQNDNNNYSKIVAESWAVCVANKLTLAKYWTNSDNIDYQTMSFDELLAPEWGGVYTPIFIDLIDNENQRVVYGNNSTDYPIDRVSGYTLEELESALYSNSTLNDIKEYLRNTYNKPSENWLDELFENYNVLKDIEIPDAEF